MGYFYYLWYLLGYDDEDDKPIMCINSFAPTGSRGINYVMKRIYYEEDEDRDYDTDDEADRYFKKNYD